MLHESLFEQLPGPLTKQGHQLFRRCLGLVRYHAVTARDTWHSAVDVARGSRHLSILCRELRAQVVATELQQKRLREVELTGVAAVAEQARETERDEKDDELWDEEDEEEKRQEVLVADARAEWLRRRERYTRVLTVHEAALVEGGESAKEMWKAHADQRDMEEVCPCDEQWCRVEVWTLVKHVGPRLHRRRD